MNMSSFDMNWFMGCCVCMLATHSISFIFQIFHIWLCILVHSPILFFMEFGALLNLV